ncbi:hypothetical protein DYB37_011507 [Aphanomyces astaci]|uniref:t-SNARE coiled-coil homology domain-containing protein n=1 Tax=Aphanomyces astaci TaxID=112090 RepID=A0A397BWI1_APHAT|nr:hypothetical protein DYB36_007886 [Aphanomyces astaci]RHY31304.1 hypothetical protein DYB25_004119 [Aphanomyces astaci]RHY43221.1 hypothetical protein DYB30_002073 [Aphanomyces astaci]RHY51164.1 hypothetical protein DYB34_002771 [Aphanomyces astaci]RHY61415.1 hypothetical protein DYB38_001680 [Aphanomyces astaci]
MAYYEPNQQQQQRDPYSQVDQDGDLDEIYAGAKRINQNARAINGEVVSQNHLLDHLGDDIEGGTSALRAQTAKAELVNKRKKKVHTSINFRS